MYKKVKKKLKSHDINKFTRKTSDFHIFMRIGDKNNHRMHTHSFVIGISQCETAAHYTKWINIMKCVNHTYIYAFERK